jgi:hypothetical protein
MLWQALAEFLFRLCFGLALTMAITPPKFVASGFYRVHCWVLLGLYTFSALVVWSQRSLFPQHTWLLGITVAAAVLSYIGSVMWLYQRERAGMVVLMLVAVAGFAAAMLGMGATHPARRADGAWALLDVLTSGMLLGSAFCAMLLGHWYLNSPTMQLLPLKRLLRWVMWAVAARGALCAAGLVAAMGRVEFMGVSFALFLALRWTSGLLGALGLVVLAWQTLKIPNTQSATGILYVAVVFVFLGELTSQLLCAGSAFPL